MVQNDKYAKIVYESEPIGKEKIVLVLTTFDIDKFNEDEKLLQIPKKVECMKYEIPKYALDNRDGLHNYLEDLESRTNAFIINRYENQIECMRRELEFRRAQVQSLMELEQNKIVNLNEINKPIPFYYPYL